MPFRSSSTHFKNRYIFILPVRLSMAVGSETLFFCFILLVFYINKTSLRTAIAGKSILSLDIKETVRLVKRMKWWLIWFSTRIANDQIGDNDNGQIMVNTAETNGTSMSISKIWQDWKIGKTISGFRTQNIPIDCHLFNNHAWLYCQYCSKDRLGIRDLLNGIRNYAKVSL